MKLSYAFSATLSYLRRLPLIAALVTLAVASALFSTAPAAEAADPEPLSLQDLQITTTPGYAAIVEYDSVRTIISGVSETWHVESGDIEGVPKNVTAATVTATIPAGMIVTGASGIPHRSGRGTDNLTIACVPACTDANKNRERALTVGPLNMRGLGRLVGDPGSLYTLSVWTNTDGNRRNYQIRIYKRSLSVEPSLYPRGIMVQYRKAPNSNLVWAKETPRIQDILQSGQHHERYASEVPNDISEVYFRLFFNQHKVSATVNGEEYTENDENGNYAGGHRVALNQDASQDTVIPIVLQAQDPSAPGIGYVFVVSRAPSTDVSGHSREIPAVSFSGDAYRGEEGSPITITLRRTGIPDDALTVEVRANGTRHADAPDTADWELDYNIGDCPYPGAPDCHHGYGTLRAEFPAGAATFTYDITTLEDDLAEGDETFHLAILTEDGGDYTAGGIPAATVTIADDDEAGITVSAETLTVEEHDDLPSDKSSATYTIALDSEPEGWVRITIRNSDTSRIRVYPGYVDFWPDHWDIPQTVKVNARFDYDAAQDTITLSHFVQAATAQYQGMTADPVTVTMTDVDTAAVVLTDNALNIDIGETAGYGVRLDAAPTGSNDVIVAAASSAEARATASPAALTFNADNWDGWQYFEVTGVAAGDVTISHSVSGSDETYSGGLIVESVMVTVDAPQAEQPPDEQAQESAGTPPGPVQNLRLTLQGKNGNNLTVEWEAPASGGAVTRYHVKLQDTDGSKPKLRRPGPRKQSIVFRNLRSGATYEVRVLARNAAGKSGWVSAQVTLE